MKLKQIEKFLTTFFGTTWLQYGDKENSRIFNLNFEIYFEIFTKKIREEFYSSCISTEKYFYIEFVNYF